MNFCIVGAGAWGTAIAVHLAKNANGSNDLEQDIVRWILEQQHNITRAADFGAT